MNQASLDRLKHFKSQFFAHPQIVHLNNAGLAPISKPAKEAIQYWGQRFFEEGFHTDHDYMLAVQKSRESLAQLIGCDSSEVAFFQSTGGGINQVAMQLDLQPQDEVLMWDQEYSSHLYPWQYACLKSGAKLKLVASDPASLETPTEIFLEALSEKTRVVAFSWMQFQSGSQMNYAEVISICKSRGIFVFVDAMQGMGILPCDLWSLGVDALTGGSHKWLVSPVGAGYLALRKNWISQMKPLQYSSATFGTCDDPSDLVCVPKSDASKFESGSKQVLEITALGSSVELILGVGVDILLAEALRLRAAFVSEIEALDFRCLNKAGRANPIINFAPMKSSKDKLIESLKRHQILYAQRGPGVRIAFHAFNTNSDLDRAVEAVKKSLL